MYLGKCKLSQFTLSQHSRQVKSKMQFVRGVTTTKTKGHNIHKIFTIKTLTNGTVSYKLIQCSFCVEDDFGDGGKNHL